MLADERTDEDGATTGCEDAAIHIIAPLVDSEVAAHMHGNKRGIQQSQLTDGREAPPAIAHLVLHDKEAGMLAAQHEAARIVADIVYHILQLALVLEEAVMKPFLPEGAEGRTAALPEIARIRATPNRQAIINQDATLRAARPGLNVT